MMEFCPEFAVFQSSLQLIYKQSNGKISTLSKEASVLFMNVIKAAVDEICRGLEQDNSEADCEAWNQKLHLICFYSIIQNYYREPVEKKVGRVPVCGTLDLMSGMVPKFSQQFYFEMLKVCSWTDYFIECLEYLDRDTASNVLHNILEHGKQDPVVPGDTEVIAIVTDKILSSCLFVPVTIDTTVSALLKPVTKQQRYVQILHPDTLPEDVTEESSDNRLKIKDTTDISEDSSDIRYIGDTFWDYFVDRNDDIIGLVIDYLYKYLDSIEASEDITGSFENTKMKERITHAGHDNFMSNIMGDIGKILLLWYLHMIGQSEQEPEIMGSWFMNNFFVLNSSGTHGVSPLTERSGLSYRVNMSLVDKIGKAEFGKKLVELVKLSVDLLNRILIVNSDISIRRQEDGETARTGETEGSRQEEKSSRSEDKSLGLEDKSSRSKETSSRSEENISRSEGTSSRSEENISRSEELSSRSEETSSRSEGTILRLDVEERKLLFKDDIGVLQTGEGRLFIKTRVLLRMLQKTFTIEADGDANGMKLILECTERSQHQNGCLILDADWWRDVTMDALLWRIENKLYMYEDCVQILLSEKCRSLWICDRVYTVMNQSPSLLCKKSSVFSCIEIMTYLQQQQQQLQQTHHCHHYQPVQSSAVIKMREVLCTSFSEMCVQDKDAVIAEMYADNTTDMRKVLGDAQSGGLQITNTFNKVSAEMDDLVLNEIFLLFLKDPVSVCEAVLEMCVKNEDQAVNSAKILCNLPTTCTTKHSLNHPDSGLIVSMIDRFVREIKMKEKEEKHFISFVKRLMKKNSKDHPSSVLSPSEFITTSLLEPIDVNNMLLGSHPIKCSLALSLLVVALECSSNVSCDWSECDFEPIVLMVNLAGILHECSEVWGGEFEDLNLTLMEGQPESMVTMVTGYQKIAMKEKLLTCVELLVNMIVDGVTPAPDVESIHWFLAITEDLNWIVKVTIAKYLYKMGHIKPMNDWLMNFHDLFNNTTDNLPFILLYGVTDPRYIEELDNVESLSSVLYEDWIAALVQILPNLMMEEVLLAVQILVMFIHKGLVPVCYRSTIQTPLLLHDLTSIQPILYVSQIMRDVILTLTLIQGERSSMLRHAMQCYVTVLKVKCSQSFKTEELHLFTLSQLFHHMCGLVENLPQDCIDNGLVLLLHLLTKFKDISMDTTLIKEKSSQSLMEKRPGVTRTRNQFGLKFVKNLENGMGISVERLSDSFEEKSMLLKKLQGPS